MAGTGGKVTTDLVDNAVANCVASTAVRHIAVAGSLGQTGTTVTSGFAVARDNSDGTPDTSFNTTGFEATGFGNVNAAAMKVLVQRDGKIAAAGHTSISSGFFNFGMLGYNSDGPHDTTFNSAGIVTTHFGLLDDVAVWTSGVLLKARRLPGNPLNFSFLWPTRAG